MFFESLAECSIGFTQDNNIYVVDNLRAAVT